MQIDLHVRTMDESEAPWAFAFFPYLKTSKPICLRGVWFKSTDDDTGLDENAVSHLHSLSSMFFLNDTMRIKRMAYTHLLSTGNTGELGDFLSTLGEIRALLGYLYSAPDPVSGNVALRLEHASLYVFWPKQVSKHLLWPEHNAERWEGSAPDPLCDEFGRLDGYEGVLNGSSFLWVAPSSRLYPPAHRIWLNISQDLAQFSPEYPVSRVNRPVRDLLNATKGASPIDARTLTALEWYCRSTASDITDDMAVVDLAIAFECRLSAR